MPKKSFKTSLALFIAEFFYCGKFPYAPGTIGSLGALFIYVPILYSSFPRWILLPIIIILFFLGLWASHYGIVHYKKNDPKQVVIDEVVGIALPFLVINAHWYEVLLAFGLFRFFDIVKPWPINMLEKRFKNAFGLMFDDVIAGFFAMILILIAKTIFQDLQ